MGLDIYISRENAVQKECVIHWHKFIPVADWFTREIYNGTVDCNEHHLDHHCLVKLHDACENVLKKQNWKLEMQEHLFPVSSDFDWTGLRELAYLQMMKTIVDDIDSLGFRLDQELRIKISF